MATGEQHANAHALEEQAMHATHMGNAAVSLVSVSATGIGEASRTVQNAQMDGSAMIALSQISATKALGAKSVLAWSPESTLCLMELLWNSSKPVPLHSTKPQVLKYK